MRPAIQRLMFISDAPCFGGAERYVLDLVAAARRRNIEPHILWLPAPEADHDAFSQSRDLPLTRVEPEHTTSLRALARAVRSAIRAHRPHATIINACGRPRFWSAAWVAHVCGVPAAWVHHMVEIRDHRRTPPRWLSGRVEGPALWRIPQTLRHRLAAAAARAVVTSNQQDRASVARWHGVPSERLHVIAPGVDTHRFRFDPAARRRIRADWMRAVNGKPEREETLFIVGAAGRLVAEKGADRLIEAVARVSSADRNVLTVIAGAGPQRGELASLASARGVTHRVHFVDFMTDMVAFYSGIDAFAQCSDSESFGLAMAEAMACERPVLATPTAGARLLIEHEQSGFRLETFSVHELARALENLIVRRDTAAAIGRCARARILRLFDIDLTLDRMLHLLERPTAPAPVYRAWQPRPIASLDLASRR